MEIVQVKGRSTYTVSSPKPIGSNEHYRLYLALQEETGRQCILQIASKKEENGSLSYIAFILTELREAAERLEVEYAKVKKGALLLNYAIGFPELVETFVSQEQGGRQVNVLAFKNVDLAAHLKPLTNIRNSQLRVDIRTSVWIMGKLLKLLAFVHAEGFSVGALNRSNILIEPSRHYVVIFDWLKAEAKMPSEEIKRKEIQQLAQSILMTLGLERNLQDHDEPEYQLYVDYLNKLAQGEESDALQAHADFYALADSLWPRGVFYPFTTKPL